ncbi:MAG: RNA polymerase sigma factor [Alphaproteobacteria bacterium]
MSAPESVSDVAEERARIGRAVLGAEADFARLLADHYDRIYRLAYRFMGRREDAEDVAQEVCIKLAQHLPGYRFEAPFAVWLSRMVMNTARDALRGRKRRQNRETELFADLEPVAPNENPERLVSAREMLRLVNDLPDGLRAAVILVYCEGMSHAEAGRALACAESTVSWRIHEARKFLQNLLGKEVKHGGI